MHACSGSISSRQDPLRYSLLDFIKIKFFYFVLVVEVVVMGEKVAENILFFQY